MNRTDTHITRLIATRGTISMATLEDDSPAIISELDDEHLFVNTLAREAWCDITGTVEYTSLAVSVLLARAYGDIRYAN